MVVIQLLEKAQKDFSEADTMLNNTFNNVDIKDTIKQSCSVFG